MDLFIFIFLIVRQKRTKVDKIYCAPGNAGIAELAECVDIGAMEFEKLRCV